MRKFLLTILFSLLCASVYAEASFSIDAIKGYPLVPVLFETDTVNDDNGESNKKITFEFVKKEDLIKKIGIIDITILDQLKNLGYIKIYRFYHIITI